MSGSMRQNASPSKQLASLETPLLAQLDSGAGTTNRYQLCPGRRRLHLHTAFEARSWGYLSEWSLGDPASRMGRVPATEARSPRNRVLERGVEV